MDRFNSPLDRVRIAAPCKADWEQMVGTDRVRFCGQCNLNVYNLSSMTKHDAESFITRNEGRLCVRFYRRADGSILTENCPVGLRAIRRRLSGLARASASAFLGFFAGLGVYETLSTQEFKQPALMGVMVQETGQFAELKEPLVQETGKFAEAGKYLIQAVGPPSLGERQMVQLGRVRIEGNTMRHLGKVRRKSNGYSQP